MPIYVYCLSLIVHRLMPIACCLLHVAQAFLSGRYIKLKAVNYGQCSCSVCRVLVAGRESPQQARPAPYAELWSQDVIATTSPGISWCLPENCSLGTTFKTLLGVPSSAELPSITVLLRQFIKLLLHFSRHVPRKWLPEVMWKIIL